MAAVPMDQGKIFSEQNVVWLYTDDLDRLAQFYGEVLGLPLVMDQGICRIFQVSPTGFLGVCNKADRPRGTRGMMFTFLVQDLDTAYARLLARGVVFDGPPELSGGGMVYSCFLHDPEGYWLQLQEFRDPRWPYPAGRGPRAA
ncbi:MULTISPECIES: VOC family protein [Roseomonadaceae]|uniref:VOC family protein n=1 Tax=Falsiroseomonas oleicola TaxID=2801474 RepID=A0ABS6HDZ1_9PROT|nr:VOC family protein [Roseomonas oleicola]MBU8546932.1 VOC family protein [Roseomonas oleicola]